MGLGENGSFYDAFWCIDKNIIKKPNIDFIWSNVKVIYHLWLGIGESKKNKTKKFNTEKL